MKCELSTLLRQAGLRDEEIRVYIALQVLRQATLSEVHVHTGLSHTTAYRTLRRLLDRGLLQELPINKKQSKYAVQSLDVLADAMSKEQLRMRRLELSLRSCSGIDIDALQKTTGDGVEVREGIDAFHEEYLKLPELGGEEFLAIGSSDSFWKASRASVESSLERSFVSRRLKHSVYSRSMMVASQDAEKIAKNDTKEMRTTKMKPRLPVMTNMLMICGNRVSHFLCDTHSPSVLILRDPELVAIHKQYFESLWES